MWCGANSDHGGNIIFGKPQYQMNPNGLNFFLDPAFRDKYIHDYNFWIVLLAMSCVILIIFFRNWTMKRGNYLVLLCLALVICVLGNILGFVIYKTGTVLGALNGPLISLLTYRLLYNWFIKTYNKAPATPYETFWSSDMSLMKDGILNFVFLMISGFSIGILGHLTKVGIIH
jgi:energy-coupling factor transporter transmembrane protein EcfT